MKSSALFVSAVAAWLFSSPLSHSNVVRPAPDFSIQIGEKLKSLKAFQGQQVVLLLADSPATRAFRRQVKELETAYDHFASSRVLFVVAFRNESTEPVASNIPFLNASAGSAACASYGLKSKFRIAIIGADGNLDYTTEQELHANRVREILQNSYTVQEAARNR